MNDHSESMNERHRVITRRRFVSQAALAAAAGLVSVHRRSHAAEAPASAPAGSQRYRIAVCDWMILKRQKLGAFQLTKDIGADGVEVDMGSLGKLDTLERALT